MPRYRLSGFVVESSVSLPELPAARGEPSFVFETGVPDRPGPRPRWYHHWQETRKQRWLSFARTSDGYLLRFPSLAEFELSSDLRRVTARRLRRIPGETLRHLLLDQVWPLVLGGSGRLVLHASAVVLPDGRALAFTGAAASGKSSLAVALACEGSRLVSDDCLLLSRLGRRWRAVPSYPGARLWPDMLERLGPGDQSVSDVAHYTSKKRLAGSRLPFTLRAAPLAGIYVVRPRGRAAAVRVAPVTGAKALMELVPFTYLLDYQAREQLERSFAQLAELTTEIPVLRLDVPHAPRRIAEVTRRLLRS